MPLDEIPPSLQKGVGEQALHPTRIFYFTPADHFTNKPVKVLDISSQIDAPYGAPKFKKQPKKAAKSDQAPTFLISQVEDPPGQKLVQLHAPNVEVGPVV